MKTRTAIPKLSSKNRYCVIVVEVRLYGGKIVIDFFVMWDPADAATWTIECGFGKTPGARMSDARERAIARRAMKVA